MNKSFIHTNRYGSLMKVEYVSVDEKETVVDLTVNEREVKFVRCGGDRETGFIDFEGGPFISIGESLPFSFSDDDYKVLDFNYEGDGKYQFILAHKSQLQ